jgi:hypothetical protein
MAGSNVDDGLVGRIAACRAAFTLATFGLALQTFNLGLGRLLDFSRGRRADPMFRALASVLQSPEWSWWVGSPITWCTVIASYLLIGKLQTPKWNNRAVALAAMNTVDVGLWMIDHARDLGLGDSWARLVPPFSVFRFGLGGLQWLELILFATLCAQLGGRLGHSEMETTQQAARASGMGGLILWGMTFAMLLHWASLPVGGIGLRRQMQWYMFYSMALVMQALTAFQTTVLCLTAVRRCRDWLRTEKAPSQSDVLAPQADPFFDAWKQRDDNAWS